MNRDFLSFLYLLYISCIIYVFFPNFSLFSLRLDVLYACLQLSKSARYWFAIQASNFKLSDEIWGEENVLILPSFMGNICTIIFYIIYLLPLFNSTITTLIKKYIYKTQSHTILVYGHDGLWYMLFHLENGNQR